MSINNFISENIALAFEIKHSNDDPYSSIDKEEADIFVVDLVIEDQDNPESSHDSAIDDLLPPNTNHEQNQTSSHPSFEELLTV